MNLRFVLFGLVLASCSQAVRAEWELVPFAGFRGGGEVEIEGLSREDDLDPAVAYGLSAAWRLDREGWIDAVWSRQDTSFEAETDLGVGGSFGVAIDHVHLGASYRPGGGRAAPFVAATLGLSLVHAEPPGYDSDLSLSLGIHGGGDFAMSPRTAIRLAGRGWLMFDGAVLSGTCGDQGCDVRLATGGGFQIEGLVGLVVKFP